MYSGICNVTNDNVPCQCSNFLANEEKFTNNNSFICVSCAHHKNNHIESDLQNLNCRPEMEIDLSQITSTRNMR